MTTEAQQEIAHLDEWFAPSGPCRLCGHPDKRHRLWDTILAICGSDEAVARYYEIPFEAVQAVRQVRPYQKDSA